MEKRFSKGASVASIKNDWRLEIPSGDSLSYRFAQMDDYSRLPRRKFPHHPPVTLSLRARASSVSIPGTWGFGLWNNPFGLSLGFGGNPFHLPALPNAAWFFSASPQNYLSFTNDKPAQGFLAQTFRAPKFHPRLIPAGLALPFSRRTTRKLLSEVVADDSVALGVDVVQWHEYKFEWNPKRVIFYVDGVQAFESPVSPNPPLGVVIWIDNQYAAFPPAGKIGFGVLENPKPAWIEISALEFGI
jgi:hypothetical protein